MASPVHPGTNTANNKLRTDSRPLYVRAEEALQQLLDSGNYPLGVQLPTEPELAQQLGISRSTLREAMRTFEERGLITRRQGVGTFVSASPTSLVIDSGLETLESVDTLVQRRGITILTQDLEIRSVTADARLSETMQIDVDTALTLVTRTKVAAHRTVAYMADWLPATLVSADQMFAGFAGSVVDYLLERDDINVSHATANITPVVADDLMATRLNLSPGASLLLFEEVVYDAAGDVVDFSRNYFVPEFFKFHVVRRIARRS